MQKTEKSGNPAEEVMTRLIEEDIWCGNPADILNSIPNEYDENTQYLREKLFPTLVPGLNEMATLQQRFLEKPNETKYGATGECDPVTWLAHYLLRNNATCKDSFIANHPYTVVSDVARQKQKENTRLKH